MSEQLKRWLLPFACILLSAPVVAASFDDEFEEKPWVEMAVQLPDYPEQGNLIPFTVGAVSDTQFLIDSKSLSVSDDGVVRYTIVVISSAGARNVSYEGLRCATAERRLYAFGRSDKTWSKARGNQWVSVRGGSNNHVVELYSNYFCKIGAAVADADDAVRVLRAR